jgi:hypothetical protein
MLLFQVEHTQTERRVMARIQHPFIVNLEMAFHTMRKLYFILEYCPGGELFFHLTRLALIKYDFILFKGQ